MGIFFIIISFLIKELNIKLRDFTKLLIDGQAPFIYYKTSYKHLKIKGISIKSKMFALSLFFIR